MKVTPLIIDYLATFGDGFKKCASFAEFHPNLADLNTKYHNVRANNPNASPFFLLGCQTGMIEKSNMYREAMDIQKWADLSNFYMTAKKYIHDAQQKAIEAAIKQIDNFLKNTPRSIINFDFAALSKINLPDEIEKRVISLKIRTIYRPPKDNELSSDCKKKLGNIEKALEDYYGKFLAKDRSYYRIEFWRNVANETVVSKLQKIKNCDYDRFVNICKKIDEP